MSLLHPLRRATTIGTLASLALFASAPLGMSANAASPSAGFAVTGDLDSKIVRRMDTVSASLDELDAYLAKKDATNASKALKAATAEMAKIHSWYGGKFDETHPDFVALTARLTAATAKVEGTEPPVKKKEEVKTGDGPAKPLDSKVARRVQTIAASLDQVDLHITGQDMKQASESLKAAEKELAKIMDWYGGKFDEQHPEFLAIKQRLADASAKVNGMGASAAGMAQELDPVMAVLRTADADLKAALNDVRQHISAFDYADSPESFAKVYADTRASVERVTAILTAATGVTTEFHKQFPDLAKLSNLVTDGMGAVNTLESIEAFHVIWDRTRDSALARFFPTDIDDQLAAFERATNDSNFSANAILNGERSIVRMESLFAFGTALIGTAPQDSKEMQAHAESVAALETQLQTLRLAVAKAKGQVADARKLKLGSARFPAPAFSGKEWTTVEATMKGLFETYTKDKKVQRVGIYSDWDQRTEARWINNKWVVGTYRYVGGTLLAELPDGRYRVYRVNFRRTLKGDGEFGDLAVFGIGHSFEVLAENIDK